ncbi:MAG: hypothetical protein M3R04_10555, partial [bacterium]|nr:hypothetical protein [bacterium]
LAASLPILFVAACAATRDKAPITEADVLRLARAHTAETCERQTHGCDAKALRTSDGWIVSVTPVLSIGPDGQHFYAVHAGWNLVYTWSGTFKGDRGW